MSHAPLRTRTAVGRADLLRVQAEHGDLALEQVAAALGYERASGRPAKPAAAPEVVPPASPPAGLDDSGPPLPERPAKLPGARFFHVSEHRQSAPEAGAGADEAPGWLATAALLTDDPRPDPASLRLPAHPALTRWSRLWPFLRRELGRSLELNQPDIPRLLDNLTRGEALRRIPLLHRHGWSPRIAILADYSRQTTPLHADFDALHRALLKRHGRQRIEHYLLADEPGAQPLVDRSAHGRRRLMRQRWQSPAPTTALLILGDLGLLDPASAALPGWQQFAGRLRSAGRQALALCPVPARLHPAELLRSFTLVEWDRHSRLRPTTARPPAGDAEARRSEEFERGRRAAESLLTLLAPALRVEPPLLRAARGLLPAAVADVLGETLIWQHADVRAGPQGFQYADKAAIARYQDAFAALAPDLQRAAVDLILAHHAGLPDSVRFSEIIASQRLAPQAVSDKLREEAQRWLRALARTAEQRPEALALQQFNQRHVDRQSDPILAADDVQAALWALAQRARVARGEAVELPVGVRPEQVRFFLDPPSERRPIACALRQRGAELCLEALDAKVGGWPPAGSPYTDLTLVDGGVFVRVRRLPTASAPAADDASVYLAASALPHRVAVLTREVERVELHAPHLALTVAGIARPRWARALGRDAYGLFSEIEVGGVRQRFRWIAPGRFLMGSPADEPERMPEREAQHEVTLSRGYWLADTACTQGLWQAVMGENPSHFKDDARNPVETVSWDDVQRFIGELQRRVGGLAVRLPSEAEWEYACRAGTTTPFSFGDELTPERVNYHGNVPYAGGAKGRYREKTVAVASLPANAWGLYEMHGNVWEWCADWYGDYANEPQVDPQGPPSGDSRVVRGGSWFSDGGRVRSADRRRFEPGNRVRFVGFRLALGPGEQVGHRRSR